MISSIIAHSWECRRDIIGSALYWSGFARIYSSWANPKGGIVLMYHSIASDNVAQFIDPPNRLSPVLFKQQMAFLSTHRNVVPLHYMIEQISAGITLEAGTVAITFDDGYLDNLHIAAPILEKYRLSATLFLATGYVQRTESQWADVLFWLFESRTQHALHLPQAACIGLNLSIPDQKQNARRIIHRYLLETTYEERANLLQEINHQLLPVTLGPPRLTLNWDEVREIVRRYPFIEIGGHTRNHIDLRTHQDNAARVEIEGCVADIERELNLKPRLFSFPYGRWCNQARQFIADGDWLGAVGANQKVRVDIDADRYAIERVDAPRTMTSFRFKTSGAFPGALSALGLGQFS